MSRLTADPGFARGETLGITNTNVYNTPTGDGSYVLGVRKTFLDENPRTGQLLSNHTVDCICVKNTSGGPLLPGEVVRFDPDDGGILSDTDAKATTAATLIGVVDEYLPAAGVPDYEIYWLVVNGPATVVKTAASVAAGATYGLSGTAGAAAAQSTNPLLGYAIVTSATETGRILVKTLAGF